MRQNTLIQRSDYMGDYIQGEKSSEGVSQQKRLEVRQKHALKTHITEVKD